jgi:hypothetical protein
MGTGDSAVTYHSSLDKHARAALVAVSSPFRSFIGELSEGPDRPDPLAPLYVFAPGSFSKVSGSETKTLSQKKPCWHLAGFLRIVYEQYPK